MGRQIMQLNNRYAFKAFYRRLSKRDIVLKLMYWLSANGNDIVNRCHRIATSLSFVATGFCRTTTNARVIVSQNKPFAI